jgi:hypothetical protein
MPKQHRATTTTRPQPSFFLELRIGSLHLTIERIPYRLLTLIAAAAGLISGATWLPR